jgi:hypothetical protein
MAITKGFSRLRLLVSDSYQKGDFFVNQIELDQSGIPGCGHKVYVLAIRCWYKKASKVQQPCLHSNLNNLVWN